MELNKNYNPTLIEDKWYKEWLDRKLFRSVPDEREPYTIVIPPPNVTGVLHMGHMLNNTLQDVLVRRARMLGKNACWVPGTDHASIATESKVVAKLKEKGINKSEISREEFLKHAWEWKEKHGGIILEQLKKLGASCDWDRTCFTMDKTLSDSVIKVFVDLYNKGYIYRSYRMVNWDPVAKTALSDEEVIYKEVRSKLWYVKYQIEGSESEYITIATTRPETILGDTAICVHPSDNRYKHLVGKNALVPLLKRPVPIIADEYVEMDFGTGALKITPAHDVNDYLLGLKYNLKFLDIFNDNASLNEQAQLYVGQDRFQARKLIVKDLELNECLLKTEDYTNKVGYSERTDEIIEPRISLQWFLKMEDLVKPAVEHLQNGNIKFYPAKFINMYMHWMNNIKDWCISRQLWWGHRIPAWYLPDGEFVVAESAEQALKTAIEKTGNKNLKPTDLRQEEDVLDTWFSSWLWPISVFDGINNPENKDIKYYYPTNDLITAPEIIFFWVARMIIAGYEFTGEKPFQNVYFTGIVRDKLKRKMSKSLGNSPDPLDLIAKYGADGVRIGMLLSSPAGNDLLFDENLCEQGRNFNNKIWNAFRLVNQWNPDSNTTQPEYASLAIKWFQSRLHHCIKVNDDQFSKYRISDALMNLYKLFWDDFCSWYLEIIKPPFGQPIDAVTYNQTVQFFEQLLLLLHPFVPFITEELWQQLNDRKEGQYIMTSLMPKAGKTDKALLKEFESTIQIITALRDLKKSKNISEKEKTDLYLVKNEHHNSKLDAVLIKMGNLNAINYVETKPADTITFIVNNSEFHLPQPANINTEEELAKLTKDLEYQKGFLETVMKKLNNENFVKSAPANVVAMEVKKKDDAITKIRLMEEQIKALSK